MFGRQTLPAHLKSPQFINHMAYGEMHSMTQTALLSEAMEVPIKKRYPTEQKDYYRVYAR